MGGGASLRVAGPGLAPIPCDPHAFCPPGVNKDPPQSLQALDLHQPQGRRPPGCPCLLPLRWGQEGRVPISVGILGRW